MNKWMRKKSWQNRKIRHWRSEKEQTDGQTDRETEMI